MKIISKTNNRIISVRTGLAFLMLTFTAIHPTLAATPQASAEFGQGAMPPGLSVNISNLPQTGQAAASRAITPPKPRTGVDEAEYQRRKDAAAKNFLQLAPTNDTGPAPILPQPGKLTPGATLISPGLQQVGGIVPSDMALAVSPSWVVQVVNSQILVTDKTGVVQAGFPKALGGVGGFFSGATTDTGDPRAFFDWKSNRFVVVADDFTGGRIWLAASSTADPRGLWNVYSFNPWGASNCRAAGQACQDFPMIGFDDDTLYLSLNLFPAAGGVSDWVLLLPKAKIYANAGFSYNFWFNLSWGGVLVDTVQPVALLDKQEHPRAGFAINTFNINFGGGQCSAAPCNGLVVWAFSNNLQAAGSPGAIISAVSVATANNYRLPANAGQPGSPFSIDSGDVRISGSPTFHAGLINAAATTNGPDGHAHVLWYQVRPFLNDGATVCTGSFLNKCAQIVSAEIANEDCYFCGGQGTAGSTYMGALAPNDAGDLTMVFVYSDDNISPLSAYVSRRVTQVRNTMHDNGIGLCGNAGFYGGFRWGDYSAAAGDLTTTTSMWFSAMNTTPGGHWGACIAKNGFTAKNQP